MLLRPLRSAILKGSLWGEVGGESSFYKWGQLHGALALCWNHPEQCGESRRGTGKGWRGPPGGRRGEGTEGDLAAHEGERHTHADRCNIWVRIPASNTLAKKDGHPPAPPQAPGGLSEVTGLQVSEGSLHLHPTLSFATTSGPRQVSPVSPPEHLQVSSRPHVQQVSKKWAPLLFGRSRFSLT